MTLARVSRWIQEFIAKLPWSLSGQTWVDPQSGKRELGLRCPSLHPDFFGAMRCMRHVAHEGNHRYTSRSDERSVTWG